MDVEIHPEAEDELNEQAAYYEYEAAGLGVVYLRTFDSTLNLAAESPEIAPVWRDVYRRFAMRRFPQSLFYFIDDQTVFVVAVAHDRRLPGYWLQRRF